MATLGSDHHFDLAAHQRGRIRVLERDLAGLGRYRQQLERILGQALEIAAGQECDPLTLLAVLEELDRRMQQPHSTASIDELVQIFRDTDPDVPKKRAAAA